MLALVALEPEADEQRRGRQDCCVPRVAPVSAPHLHPAEWHPHLMPWHQVTMLCNSCLHLLTRKWNQVTVQFLLRPVNKKMKPGHSALQFLLTPVNKKMESSHNALQFLLTPVNKKMAPVHNGNADYVFCMLCNSCLHLSTRRQHQVAHNDLRFLLTSGHNYLQFLLTAANKKTAPHHNALQLLLMLVNKKMEPGYKHNALQFLLTTVNKKWHQVTMLCNSCLHLLLC